MIDWNPNQYLKFVRERTQPSIDLAARIGIQNPASVIDIGCGPGNSTAILRSRWPGAKITGLDSSPNMLDRAKADYPEAEWITGDATSFTFRDKYDVVFSNAALQWMPDHEVLLPRLYDIVAANGALAVQVPADFESPIRRAVISVSKEAKWSKHTEGCDHLLNYRTAPYYYDILSALSAKVDLWETSYYHVLSSHSDLVEWYKGTGMRPFLERLPDDSSRKSFEQEVLEGCRNGYEIRRDGKLLYPFKRVFFVAYK